MAVALNSTLTSDVANSYVTVEEADDLVPLLVSTARSTAWLARTPAEKSNLLIRAAKLMDTYFDWEGIRVIDTQALAWPRHYFTAPDFAVWFDHTKVPQPVLEAQVLFAVNLGEDFEPTTSAGAVTKVTSVKFSSIAVSFDSDREAVATVLVPLEVYDKLRGFGWYVGNVAGPHTVKLERA
jgi:hypothetical protein